MISEIICVGDELLVGQVTDTNSTYLAKQLAGIGLGCQYKTIVGDNKNHVVAALKTALKRANIIVFTGGLGPTQDDLTVESIAEALEVPLIFRTDIAEKIKSFFDRRGVFMPENNLKQAYIPQGADILSNNSGTAPGIYWDLAKLLNSTDKKTILAFPGVPREMEYLWETYALDILKPLSTRKLYEKYINFAGIGESTLVTELPEFFDLKDPVILPYANNFQVQLRVYSEKEDIEEAKWLVEDVCHKICRKMGNYVYGYNNDTLESVVGKYLADNNMTIAIAESCTGGLISSRLTDVPGSSGYIKYNVVAYSNEAKVEHLSVSEKLLAEYGAVSAKVASQMAQNVRTLSKADIGLAISGIAGPSGGSNLKPVGTVYIALADKANVFVESPKFNLALTRLAFKYCFSQYALNFIRKYCLENQKTSHFGHLIR